MKEMKEKFCLIWVLYRKYANSWKNVLAIGEITKIIMVIAIIDDWRDKRLGVEWAREKEWNATKHKKANNVKAMDRSLMRRLDNNANIHLLIAGCSLVVAAVLIDEMKIDIFELSSIIVRGRPSFFFFILFPSNGRIHTSHVIGQYKMPVITFKWDIWWPVDVSCCPLCPLQSSVSLLTFTLAADYPSPPSTRAPYEYFIRPVKPFNRNLIFAKPAPRPPCWRTGTFIHYLFNIFLLYSVHCLPMRSFLIVNAAVQGQRRVKYQFHVSTMTLARAHSLLNRAEVEWVKMWRARAVNELNDRTAEIIIHFACNVAPP